MKNLKKEKKEMMKFVSFTNIDGETRNLKSLDFHI